jgi:flagellar hook-length control protein FliK
MTLQASREMDTSLQTNNLPAPANQLETANQSNEAVSADITDVTDIDPDVVVPASPLAEKPSAVNNHTETKQIPFSNKNQEPAVANVKSDTAVVPDPELVTDDLSVSQPVSESVKNQPELSLDLLSESEMPSQLTPSPDSDLQEAVQATATIQQNVAEGIENVSVTQAAADVSAKVATSADTASPSNDKIQHGKADKKVKATETPRPDPAMAAMLANMQPVVDKPINPAASITESDADLISTMPEADDVADATNKTESSVKSASLGNMIHDFVGMLKNNDDPVSSAGSVIANNVADDKDTSNTVDEASSEQGITASQSGDISPDQASTNTTAESVNNKADHPTTFDAGLNKDTAAVNSLAHENHGVSVTGKSALSSTGNLPEQAQGLRNITEQLPSLYMKNGHVEEHELAARVMLMVGEKWHEAELQLEPQGMGKIRVQLSIDQEQQTNVQFMVQHSQAKEALDQSLPRLRELLIQHGLQPGQTQVQQQTQDNTGQSWNQQMANNSAAEQQARRNTSPAGNAFSSSNDDEFAQTVTVSASEAAGIDFYA